MLPKNCRGKIYALTARRDCRSLQRNVRDAMKLIELPDQSFVMKLLRLLVTVLLCATSASAQQVDHPRFNVYEMDHVILSDTVYMGPVPHAYVAQGCYYCNFDPSWQGPDQGFFLSGAGSVMFSPLHLGVDTMMVYSLVTCMTTRERCDFSSEISRYTGIGVADSSFRVLPYSWTVDMYPDSSAHLYVGHSRIRLSNTTDAPVRCMRWYLRNVPDSLYWISVNIDSQSLTSCTVPKHESARMIDVTFMTTQDAFWKYSRTDALFCTDITGDSARSIINPISFTIHSVDTNRVFTTSPTYLSFSLNTGVAGSAHISGKADPIVDSIFFPLPYPILMHPAIQNRDSSTYHFDITCHSDTAINYRTFAELYWRWKNFAGKEQIDSESLIVDVDVHNAASVSSSSNEHHVAESFAFPNPGDAELSIAISVDEGTYRYVLLNEAGQQVWDGQAEGTLKFNAKTLPSGVYYITCSSNSRMRRAAIMIRH